MRDREHVHPLALAVLEDDGDILSLTDSQDAWLRNPRYLTPRASAVLAAVEEAMGDGTYCNGWTDCDACEARSECCPDLMKIAAAWKEHADV